VYTIAAVYHADASFTASSDPSDQLTIGQATPAIAAAVTIVGLASGLHRLRHAAK
jgi:hypothetical protein